MTQAFEIRQVIYPDPAKDASYPIPFRYLAANEVSASFIDADGLDVQLLTNGVDFTITPDADTEASDGTLTLLIAAEAGDALLIMGATRVAQYYSATPGAEGVEAQEDRTILALQELHLKASQSLVRFPSDTYDLTLPKMEAGRFLAAAEDGTKFTWGPNAAEISGASAAAASAAADAARAEAAATSNSPAFSSAALASAYAAGATDGDLFSLHGQEYKVKSGADVIPDVDNAVPSGALFLEHFGQNTTPGTTEMNAALIAARDYILGLGYKFPVRLDLGGKAVGLEGTVFFPSMDGIAIVNGSLHALGDVTDYPSLSTYPTIPDDAQSGTAMPGPLIAVSSGKRATLDNVSIFCNRISSGVRFRQTEYVEIGSSFYCHGWAAHGFAVETDNTCLELNIDNAKVQQWDYGETGFDDQAQRTGFGFLIRTPDATIDKPVANYCRYPFYKEGYGSWKLSDPHFYNGALTTVTDAGAIYGAYIAEPANGIISGGYWDQAALFINADDLHSVNEKTLQVLGNWLPYSSGTGSNTNQLQIYTTVANNNLAGLTIADMRFSPRAANVAMLTDGVTGSYISDRFKRWTISNVMQSTGGAVTGLGDEDPVWQVGNYASFLTNPLPTLFLAVNQLHVGESGANNTYITSPGSMIFRPDPEANSGTNNKVAIDPAGQGINALFTEDGQEFSGTTKIAKLEVFTAGTQAALNNALLVENSVQGKNFTSRTAFVAAIDGGAKAPEGYTMFVGSTAWQYDSSLTGGSVVIADMPQWKPALNVQPNHWKENSTPGTTDMLDAIHAAWGYSKHLQFLPEIYAHDGEIVFRGETTSGSFEGFSLKGAGPESTIFKQLDLTANGMRIDNNIAAPASKFMQGVCEGFSLHVTGQTLADEAYGLTIGRSFNSRFRDITIDGYTDHVVFEQAAQNKIFSIYTRNGKRGAELSRYVWSVKNGAFSSSYGNELFGCEHHAGSNAQANFYLQSADQFTVHGGHFNSGEKRVILGPDGRGTRPWITQTRFIAVFFDGDAVTSITNRCGVYIEATDPDGNGRVSSIEGVFFDNCIFRNGVHALQLATGTNDLDALLSLENIWFRNCHIYDFSGRIFEMRGANLPDVKATVRTCGFINNEIEDRGDTVGRTAADAAFWIAGTQMTVSGNSIYGGWDDSGEPVIYMLPDSEACNVTHNNALTARTNPVSNAGTDNVVAGNNEPNLAGEYLIDSPLRVGNTSGPGIIISPRTATTDSDLVFSGNAVVGVDGSVSFTMQSGGYFRFMKNATDPKTGTAGATEIARVNDGGVDITGALTLRGMSADPPNPASGRSVEWMADGTGTGDAGDIMRKTNVGGTVKTETVSDYSAI